MLRINQRHMEALKTMAVDCFEDELVSRIKRIAPRLGSGLDGKLLRQAARDGIRRAGDYGFSRKGPIRLFVESMLLLGSHFDSDPQYPVVASQLRGSGNQMLRADRIYHEIITYQSDVLGERGGALREALVRLIALARGCGEVEGSDASMQRALASSFPTKAAYVGGEVLAGLVRSGRKEARGHGLHSVRSHMLLVTAMFTLGHGVSRDWSYPDMAHALMDIGVEGSRARAERLESTTLSLLEQTLADVSKEPEQWPT